MDGIQWSDTCKWFAELGDLLSQRWVVFFFEVLDDSVEDFVLLWDDKQSMGPEDWGKGKF